MNLFIPEIGTKLKLTASWTFVLCGESRNAKLFQLLGKTMSYRCNEVVTIPEGTTLSVDRIYIRKGVSNYSSVTFTIPKDVNKKHPLAGSRFWAKLSDANKIEFELLECNEETLALITKIDEKTKIVLPSIDQSRFMKMLLNNKTINQVRPKEPPSHFVLKVFSTMQKFCKERPHMDKVTKDNLEKALLVFIRAHKLSALPTEDQVSCATCEHHGVDLAQLICNNCEGFSNHQPY